MHVRCHLYILNLMVNDGLKEYHSSINKIRYAVRDVRASLGRMDRFKICIKEGRIVDKCTMQLDVLTRWNSTYIIIEIASKFRKAFKRPGEKCYQYVMLDGGVPNNEDWDNVRCFIKLLKIFFDITQSFRNKFCNFFFFFEYFNEHCMILLELKWG
uniref:AC transposase n=1 Tax=Cajanus cajan TaxID=3821 RepID=A0A151RJ13_CAJCA|nr:Putative AC transposase [Cajanus cajan]